MRLPRINQLKPSKTWVVLITAVSIGLLAAWAASNYLRNRVADIETQARRKNVNIVVAKVDLPKGSTLSTANLAVRPIPGDFAHSQAILPEQFERIEGQVLAFGIKAGEMVLWGLLEGKRVPTFSARVEAGRRAVTVPVDEINSISGLLEPGDLIDLMVTMDQKGKKLTLPLLHGVQVMATGQRSVDDPKSGERRLYSTVTLDTDPKQAQAVVMAREAGRLTALLRNPDDKGAMPGNTVDFAALMNATETNGSQMLEAGRQVPVLYGGRGGKLDPNDLQMAGAVPSASLQAQAAASVVAPGYLSSSTVAAPVGPPPLIPAQR